MGAIRPAPLGGLFRPDNVFFGQSVAGNNGVKGRERQYPSEVSFPNTFLEYSS
jgi:hypothetical protein